MDSSLEDLKRALEAGIEGMSTEQLRWHPADKWCAAEVLEHLYLTYTGTIRGFHKVMAENKPQATPASMVHRMRRLLVVGFGYLPEGRKAPPTTRPKGLPWEQVRNGLGANILAMDAVIGQCELRFGRRTPLLDHPILGPLTAAQWRRFHAVHGWHHQKQLLRLREGMRRAG